MTLRTSPQGGGGSVYADGSSYGTNTHTMDTAAQYVDHVGDVMTSEVNNLFGALTALNPSTWKGGAADAFYRAQDHWGYVQKELVKALGEIAGGLRTSSQKYDQADTDSQYGITSAVSQLDY